MSRKSVKAEIITVILVAIRNANKRLSCVISRNQNWKIMVSPIGWKKACIKKINPAAGTIKRSALVKYSLATLPVNPSGTITRSNKIWDVQYHGLKIEIRIILNAKIILVKGLRL